MRQIFFIIFVIFLNCIFAEPLKVHVSSLSAILMNAETGAILYEKNAHDRRFPASITKVATLLYALTQKTEHLDEIVTCPYHCLKRINPTIKEANSFRDPAYWLETDGCHYWIKQGEKLPFIDLLYGMMLISGNDASNYVAHHVGGSIPKFMNGMNIYLKQIGCKNTHFKNPHGLHHPEHVTTAYDMAFITREALKNPLIRQIVLTKEYVRSETNLQPAKTFEHTNELIQVGKFFYPNAIGLKTGYTSRAKYTLVSAAKQGERTLIAVLLAAENPQERYRDAIRLFETAFAEQKIERLLFKKEDNLFMREIKKAKMPLRASLFEDVSIHYFPSEEPNVTIELNWEELPLPIKAGSWVGEMHVIDQGQNVIQKVPLYAWRDVKKGIVFALVDAFKSGSLDFTPLRNVLITLLFLCLSLSLYFIYRVDSERR